MNPNIGVNKRKVTNVSNLQLSNSTVGWHPTKILGTCVHMVSKMATCYTPKCQQCCLAYQGMQNTRCTWCQGSVELRSRSAGIPIYSAELPMLNGAAPNNMWARLMNYRHGHSERVYIAYPNLLENAIRTNILWLSVRFINTKYTRPEALAGSWRVIACKCYAILLVATGTRVQRNKVSMHIQGKNGILVTCKPQVSGGLTDSTNSWKETPQFCSETKVKGFSDDLFISKQSN